MKLSEIRPCDNCGGKIAPTFYLVKFSIAMFDARSTNQVLGMHQFFGNQSLQLAEMFSPSEDAVLIAGEKEPKLWTTLIICQDCFLTKDLNLAVLAEKVSKPDADDPVEDGG